MLSCAAASFAYSSGNRLYADGRPFYHMGLNAYWCVRYSLSETSICSQHMSSLHCCVWIP